MLHKIVYDLIIQILSTIEICANNWCKIIQLCWWREGGSILSYKLKWVHAPSVHVYVCVCILLQRACRLVPGFQTSTTPVSGYASPVGSVVVTVLTRDLRVARRPHTACTSITCQWIRAPRVRAALHHCHPPVVSTMSVILMVRTYELSTVMGKFWKKSYFTNTMCTHSFTNTLFTHLYKHYVYTALLKTLCVHALRLTSLFRGLFCGCILIF